MFQVKPLTEEDGETIGGITTDYKQGRITIKESTGAYIF